jgi:hypothetical protein
LGGTTRQSKIMDCDNQEATKADTLAKLIADFIGQDGCFANDEVRAFRNLNIEEAIEKAVLVFNEKVPHFNHRWNLKNHPEVPQKVASILLKLTAEIQSRRNFDDLHEFIKSKIWHIPFVGELYCYDTAFRIGISKDIYPDKIYLHAGTRKGAMSLGIYKKGKEVLEKSELLKKYPEFKNMKAYQIEDFLCIKEKEGVLKKFKRL